MSKFISMFVCFLAALSICDAYKILVVYPMAARSHANLGYGLVKHLLKAGHQVTYITPFIENNSDPNLIQVNVSSNQDLLPKDIINLKNVLDLKSKVADHKIMFYVMNLIHETTLKHPEVKKLLEDPKKSFDVVLSEWMFGELSASYAAVFDAPLIWVSSMEPHWFVMSLIDEHLHPAYNADCFSTNIAPFTFLQRAEELWIQIKVCFYMYFNKQEQIYNDLVVPIIAKRGRKAPAFQDLIYNGSLVLGNSHLSLGEATRLPQNYKPIAGYHIDKIAKPLPADLKKIMDSADDGVIYFSMGSNLKSKDLPVEIKDGLIKIFGELKQTVIWKFEEAFPNAPKNVHIVQWAPQQSILSHPNCILFITHGGLLSTTESVHFGVPTIGIPVFGDQFINVDRSVKKGFAKKVELSYTMADELKAAIQEMISNPSYKAKIKELSLIYHDRPVSPGAELVHWVEHVVKTRGALHLRSPALHVPLYQKLYLDLLAVILALLYVVYRILCSIKNLIASLFSKPEVKKKKRN